MKASKLTDAQKAFVIKKGSNNWRLSLDRQLPGRTPGICAQSRSAGLCDPNGGSQRELPLTSTALYVLACSDAALPNRYQRIR
jgi:hypothetical protein